MLLFENPNVKLTKTQQDLFDKTTSNIGMLVDLALNNKNESVDKFVTLFISFFIKKRILKN